VQLLEGQVVEGEEGSGVHQEPLAVRGERDLAGGAGEQPPAELPLEPGDVAAEGLLGQVEPGGGAGEVQLLGNGDEMTQQTQVQLTRHRPGTSTSTRLTL
jgi:hypothetical protein